MTQRITLIALLATFSFIFSCGPANNFNPCPKGSLPLKDTVFGYIEQYYDEPTSFRIYPDSRINLSRKEGGRFEMSTHGNILSRFQAYQQGDTFTLDFKSCIFAYNPLDLTIVASDITSIYTHDSCVFAIDESFATPQLVVDANGETQGMIDGDINTLKVNSYSTDTLRTAGSHKLLYVNQHGDGVFDAQKATVLTADVANFGKGSIFLPVCDTIYVEIADSGNVYYRGEPFIIPTISGFGELIKLN